MAVAFVRSGSVVTLLLMGSSYQVDEGHKNYGAIFEALKRGASEKEVHDLVTARKEPEVVKKPTINVKRDGASYVDGVLKVVVDGKEKEVEQCLQDEMDSLDADDLPVQGMLNFVERLYNNVSMRVRQELLHFIKLNGLTIDSDGFILTYKAVRNNYMDKWEGKYNNSPGSVVEMPRDEVNDNCDIGCSRGLHSGALTYVHDYGHGDDRIIIVKIDPADVVSVPKDCSFKKIRCCKYTVIGDYNGKLAKSVYESNKTTDEMYATDEAIKQTYDWDEMEGLDDDEFDDDEFDEDDDEFDDCCKYSDQCVGGCKDDLDKVDSITEKAVTKELYGIKPSTSKQAGWRYHARRDKHGRFC